MRVNKTSLEIFIKCMEFAGYRKMDEDGYYWDLGTRYGRVNVDGYFEVSAEKPKFDRWANSSRYCHFIDLGVLQNKAGILEALGVLAEIRKGDSV